jgi:Skp family chaperone for outer membrane proteins
MKRSLVLATLLASGFTLSVAAQTPAAAPAAVGPSKIAVIAFQVAVAQTNEGQRNFADLQKKYQPQENVLKSQNDEIESLTKQLQAQGATLSEADRASKARVIDEKKKKLDRDAEDLRNQGGQEAQDMYRIRQRPGIHSGSRRLPAAESHSFRPAVNRHHQTRCRSLQRQVRRPRSASLGGQPGRCTSPQGSLSPQGSPSSLEFQTDKRPLFAGPFCLSFQCLPQRAYFAGRSSKLDQFRVALPVENSVDFEAR